MSTEAIISIIFQIIGTMIAMAVGLWKYSETMNRKFEHERKNQSTLLQMHMEQQTKAINRVYERMDERQEEANKTFVRLDVHNLTVEHLDNKTDEKFRTIVDTFELKMQSLTKAVNELVIRINNSNKNGG